uniref:Uncharacterized protein MANES_02G211700 n=1 Tax=Rhizophora mucronata TaxID=61149 RepID=A0A2P2K5S7_RHIMU
MHRQFCQSGTWSRRLYVFSHHFSFQGICKRSSLRAQNGKPAKQRHSRMLGKPQEIFLSSYMRQIWSLCLLTCHPI